MAESRIPLDEAADYLLGRLTPAAGRRFEARLTQDAELRRHLRELEEGVLALALSAPPLRPPREAWSNIQSAVAGERQSGSMFMFLPLRWLFSGWPVAGGLAVALCIHIALVHQGVPGQKSGAPSTAGRPANAADQAATVALPARMDAAGRANANAAKPGAPVNALAAGMLATGQTGGIPLAGHETGWDKEAASGPEGGVAGGVRPPPRLKRAVLLAMARQMGLTDAQQAQVPALAAAQAQVPVDYVELPNPIPAATPVFSPLDALSLPGTATADPILQSNDPNGAISMFASGNDLMVILDPAMLPANIGPVTIWVEDAEGIQTIVGTVNLGTNPMVITIQNADLSANYRYTVTASGGNILASFP
jgi:hypothetical protein